MEQLFYEQQAAIRKAAAFFCRRYGFSREQIEDFTQDVLAKIWADDCAVLRKWQRRSSLSTYLAMVVQRALLDFVNHHWGKWRPTAKARRLGPLAVDLETLLARDGLGLDEACQTLRSRGTPASDAELRKLADKLPPRSPRRLDGSYESEGGGARGAGANLRGAMPGQRAEPAAAESADELLWSKERERWRQATFQALTAAVKELPAEDRRVIAKLLDDFSIAEIARIWKLDQKALYRRKDKILECLREALERAGINAEDVEEFLGHADS